MKKSLVVYLQYLQDSHNKQLAVSLAEFREYAAGHAVVSARDGNDYAVFNDGSNYVTVTLSNSGFIGRSELLDFLPSGQGDVNIYAVFDELRPAHEWLIQVMIFDNDLKGDYDSNV